MQTDPTGRRSLWQDLYGGSASAGILIVVSIALAAALAGAGLIGSYALAAIVPSWNYSYTWPGQRPVRPTDDLVGTCMLLAALAWAAALAFLWSRGRGKYKHVFYASAATVGIAILTIILCVLAVLAFRGSNELIVGGIVLIAGAVTMMMWVQIWRHYGWGRPFRDFRDGEIDLRCPQCGYRMVGLKEARCPECGSEYTLDELLGRQNFAASSANEPASSNGGAERPAPPPVRAP